MTDTVGILGVAMRHGRRLIERKENTDPPKFFKDFLRNSVFVKGGQV